VSDRGLLERFVDECPPGYVGPRRTITRTRTITESELTQIFLGGPVRTIEVREFVSVPAVSQEERVKDALLLARVVELVDEQLLVHHRRPKRNDIASALGMQTRDGPSGTFKRSIGDWRQLVQGRMTFHGIAMSDLSGE
jgi:hypothetical protein